VAGLLAIEAARITHPADRQAFRAWFTYLAEAQFFVEDKRRSTEIKDCSSLVRYAYREALRRHDSAWLGAHPLPSIPALPPLRSYRLDLVKLFHVNAAAYSQFADAQTLRRWNCFRTGSDLQAARPGDLLFFEQRATAEFPHHVMVFVGKSHFAEGGPWIVYHTGPSGSIPGVVRRVTVKQLLQHPEAWWRPVRDNPNFLGIYRWNILREGD
jgi:uncharacterized protein YfaT (DUF1175 family)